MIKKVLFTLFLVPLFIVSLSSVTSASGNSTNESPNVIVQDNGVEIQAAATRIWIDEWTIISGLDQGVHRYFSTNRGGVLYRGYLTRFKDAGSIQVYRGYLYRGDLHYPVPNSYKPLES